MPVLADKDVHPDQSVLDGFAGGHFQAALDLDHVTAFGGRDAALRIGQGEHKDLEALCGHGIDVEFLVSFVL
jgi:hypothetical protein